MRNTSIITADRATHLRIVAVSLFASVAVMIVGIAARPQAEAGPQAATVMKAGKAMLAGGADTTTIR
jgi:hypothetical protein